MLLSKHRSIACPVPLALASDLPCSVCTCKWDLQLLSPGWLWTDFPRPRGWRVTTALGNPFSCGTALGNPFPCRKVCFAQKALLDKSPLRLPEFSSSDLQGTGRPKRLPGKSRELGGECRGNCCGDCQEECLCGGGEVKRGRFVIWHLPP